MLIETTLTRATRSKIAAAKDTGSLAGRAFIGFLTGRLPAMFVSGGALALPVLGCALMLTVGFGLPVTWLASATFGIAVGSGNHVIALLMARISGMRNFGAPLGVTVGISCVFDLGTCLAGLPDDITGTYRLLLIASIPLLVISAVLAAEFGLKANRSKLRETELAAIVEAGILAA